MIDVIINNLNEPLPKSGDGLEAAFNCWFYINALIAKQTEGTLPLIPSIDMELVNEYSSNPKDKMKLNLTLDKSETDITLHNLLNFAIGNLFQHANDALESKFGLSKKSNNPDTNVAALRAICFSVRCASAHGDGKAEWYISDQYFAKNWSITYLGHTINVDLTSKNGQLVSNKDFGGTKNMILVIDFARSLVR